ncbi:MAG: hemerythrin family protein [Synergistaceae bacterium]|jgi:hemerythrin|nr:hemerythrin family protein [Synergistaceae bacterium]
MVYGWDSSLETGHEIIDTQHQQMITAVSGIYGACLSGGGSVELINSLDFLNCYIVKHFSEEEKLMVGYGYPGYEYHRRYHESFRVDIRGVTRRLMKGGAADSLALDVLDGLAIWLINHIKEDDSRLTAYISSMAALRG